MKLADDITANIARFAENERRCRRELMMQRTSLTGHSPARGRVLYEPRRVEGCRGKAVGGSTRIVVGGKVRVRLFRPLPSSWKAWQTHPPRRLNSNYRRNLPDHLSAATAATQAHHPARSRVRATRCAAQARRAGRWWRSRCGHPPERAAQRSPRRLAARISSERAGSAAATARASTSAPTNSLSICSARSRRARARLPRDGLRAR